LHGDWPRFKPQSMEPTPSNAAPPLVAPPAVILDQPQLAENIGACARVMANFGLADLRLVNPRDGWPQDRAWASASGADWPLRDAKLHTSVAEAIADLHLVYAATARPRETRLPVHTPREAAAALHQASSSGLKIGILFGAERAGLETMDIALCNAIVTLPVDPRFRSLNLAQAVAVNAYEWRTTILNTPPAPFLDQTPPADQAAMLGLYEHLEAELEFSGFFFPPEKKPSMIRNLRVALGRARFTDQEARTFRGVITALTKGRGRTLARLADKGLITLGGPAADDIVGD
jgi:tRNA/rRNA methyltransferase